MQPTAVLEEMMQCPYSLQYLSQHGRQPRNPDQRGPHGDGSGMAFSKAGTVEVHKRSRENAWDVSYQELVRNTFSRVFLAHNRLATEGLEASRDGAHPFSVTAAGRTFALCHNGSVRSYMEEARKAQTSDSCVFLQRIIDSSGKNDVDSIFGRLVRIAETTDYSSLCAMLMTTEELFVWRIYGRGKEEKIPDYEKYYTLYMMLGKDSAVFSSEPLDDRPWMLLLNNTFMHLKFNRQELELKYRSI